MASQSPTNTLHSTLPRKAPYSESRAAEPGRIPRVVTSSHKWRGSYFPPPQLNAVTVGREQPRGEGEMGQKLLFQKRKVFALENLI